MNVIFLIKDTNYFLAALEALHSGGESKRVAVVFKFWVQSTPGITIVALMVCGEDVSSGSFSIT